MDQNINDLVNAAKLKLETQQKQNGTPEDIYADIREENNEEQYPNISYEEQQPYSEYNIQYEPEPEKGYYIDPNANSSKIATILV